MSKESRLARCEMGRKERGRRDQRDGKARGGIGWVGLEKGWESGKVEEE